jgi:hypothetical protein
MPKLTVREALAVRDAALDRRARLSTRALLALVAQIAKHVDQGAARLRARLDPRGGAMDPLHAA